MYLPLNASSHKDVSWDRPARQHEMDVDPCFWVAPLPSGDMHASWVILLTGFCHWLRQQLETLPANKNCTVSDGLKFYTLTRRGNKLFVIVFWFLHSI